MVIYIQIQTFDVFRHIPSLQMFDFKVPGKNELRKGLRKHTIYNPIFIIYPYAHNLQFVTPVIEETVYVN